MSAGAESDRCGSVQGGADARGSWAPLAAAWCGWLLAWLVPATILAPRLLFVRGWMSAESAPSAMAAAAAFFLVAVWPFWPGLAGRPAGAGRATVRWAGCSVLEAAALLALAAPFAAAAWSLGGRPPGILRPGAIGAGLAAAGLVLRLLAAWAGPRGERWVILGAMLAAVGPLAVAYAAAETLGAGPGSSVWQLLQASPVWQAARLAG